MEYTNDYDLYIDRLNVQDILSYAGYKFIRKDGLKYPCFQKIDSNGRRIRGDKFIVTQGGKCCFQPPQIRSFNVISLIKEHPELFAESANGKSGTSLVHAVCRKILNMDLNKSVSNEIAQYQSQLKPFNIEDYALKHFKSGDKDSQKAFFPYFKNRGIGLMTQSIFRDHFCLASHTVKEGKQMTNLSFPLTIPGKYDGKTVGFEERGRPRLDGSSGYKGKAAGSNGSEGLWIASPDKVSLKDTKNIYWFESAYDAMAYFQTHIKKDFSLYKSVFLSTGGTPTVMQYKEVLKEAQNATHHLCFDNDLAGKQFVHNFEDSVKRFTDGNVDYVRETPKEGFKDWNDELLGKAEETKKGGMLTVMVTTCGDIDGDGEDDTIEVDRNFEEKKKQHYARHM